VYHVKREVRQFEDLEELSTSAAADISSLMRETISSRGKFSLALSGGSTPSQLYSMLGTLYKNTIDWKCIHIYWGDERYVSHSDPQSNYKMAKEILLDSIPIPKENVHAIPTGSSNPDADAHSYEEQLRKDFPLTAATFDLVLLGMGKEGHTASLFPNSPALGERERWVTAVNVPVTPSTRITLTLPILNRASAVYFLVSGREKSDALSKVFDDDSSSETYPAKAIVPLNGRLIWWVDSAAMGR